MAVSYKTVANICLKHIYLTLLKLGLNEIQIYKNSGIKKEDVLKESGRINYHNYLACIEYARKLGVPIVDSTIWSLSIMQLMESFGELFGLCLNCSTAKEALTYYFRYRGIIGESDFLILNQEKGKIRIQYINEEKSPSASLHACANFVFIYQLLQFYNQNMSIRCDTRFVGALWSDNLEYDNFFKGAIRFNEPVNCMEFDSWLLEGPSSLHNPILSPYLERKVQTQLMQIQTYKSGTTTQIHERVRELIWSIGQEEGLDNLNINIVCKELNMSRWTLRRKLGEVGINYQKIVSDIRREEAIKRLSDHTLVIGDISDKLGFSSQSAFSRFFSLHFGMTPSEYRFAAGDWQAQR